jgi:hypothetical protein
MGEYVGGFGTIAGSPATRVQARLLSTIHPNGVEQAFLDPTTALQSDLKVPYPAIRHGLAECLQLFVHLGTRHGHRVVTDLLYVHRYYQGTDTCELEAFLREDREWKVRCSASAFSLRHVTPGGCCTEAEDAGREPL